MEDRLAAIAEQTRSSFSGPGYASLPVRIHIVTMGCAKNEVDSAHMADLLMEEGCVVVDGASEADCIIVNTCSFIQAATEESIEAVLDFCGLPNVEAGKAKVVVAGCMPSRYGQDLADELTEASSFVPCSDEDKIASVVGRLFPGRLGSAQLSLSLGGPSAYVKISDGCDRFCSFCTIPYIRGRYHSFAFAQVHEDVARAVASGAREIVLIAQDTGRWGQDLREMSTLASLLESLAQTYPETWFRVMYVQPEGVSSELLDVMASHDNIASYLDVPFQHASTSVLAAMNRKGSAQEHLALIDRIRSRVPGISLRTTLIAGFPGESEQDFEELCAFVEEAEFDYVGVFAYSREDGTRAAKLLGQIDEDEKAARASHLRDIADSISALRMQRYLGTTADVLVLGREDDGQLYGRAVFQAPDVDGLVYLDAGEVSSFVRARIVDCFGYDMEGVCING